MAFDIQFHPFLVSPDLSHRGLPLRAVQINRDLLFHFNKPLFFSLSLSFFTLISTSSTLYKTKIDCQTFFGVKFGHDYFYYYFYQLFFFNPSFNILFVRNWVFFIFFIYLLWNNHSLNDSFHGFFKLIQVCYGYFFRFFLNIFFFNFILPILIR